MVARISSVEMFYVGVLPPLLFPCTGLARLSVYQPCPDFILPQASNPPAGLSVRNDQVQ